MLQRITILVLQAFMFISGGAQNNTTLPPNLSLSALETEVLSEINLLRADPKAYANCYIAPRLNQFTGSVYNQTLTTEEGKAVVIECLTELKKTAPLPLLKPDAQLMVIARQFTKQQGRTNEVGHTAPDGKDFFTRYAAAYARGRTVGENLCYGITAVRDMIVELLIDDGVASRGHRKNLLNHHFTRIGIGYGKHLKYQVMLTLGFLG